MQKASEIQGQTRNMDIVLITILSQVNAGAGAT